MENDDAGKFFIVGPHNVGKIFDDLRKQMREGEVKRVFQVIESGDFSKIRRCHVCGVGMLTQPMSMVVGMKGMQYFCEDHIDLF